MMMKRPPLCVFLCVVCVVCVCVCVCVFCVCVCACVCACVCVCAYIHMCEYMFVCAHCKLTLVGLRHLLPQCCAAANSPRISCPTTHTF